MMQAIQTGKVSFTGGCMSKCDRLGFAARSETSQQAISTAEVSSMDVVTSHDGLSVAQARPAQGIAFCQAPASCCKLSAMGSAAEHEPAPVFGCSV